jgi:hypothetical protein
VSGCFARPCAHEGIEKLAKRLRSSLSKQFPRAHRCCSMTAFWRKGGTDTRSLAGMSGLGLRREFAKVGTVKGPAIATNDV